MRRAGLRSGLGIAALWCVGVGAGLGTGCATGGPPPEDHFYRLPVAPATGPAGPRAGTPALPGVLQVERLRADAVTGARALVWSRGPASPELERHRYHHWADPPVDMIQERMAEALRAAGVAGSVVTPGMRVRPDYRLTGRLEHFERLLGESGPAVLVEMRLILQARDEVLWRRRYAVRAPAAGGSVPEAVDAFGAAVAEILAELARDLESAAPTAAGPDAVPAPGA